MNYHQHASAAKSAADSMNELRLAAARKRLAQSTSKEDALEGIREIVANLLGCEEIGLFKVNSDSQSFSACWSFGADLENFNLHKALGTAGRERVMRGESHLIVQGRDQTNGAAMGEAFVPLRVGNQTVGILAILRLLPQKAAFDGHDMELFKLLSEEAAKPLFGAIGDSKARKKSQGI